MEVSCLVTREHSHDLRKLTWRFQERLTASAWRSSPDDQDDCSCCSQSQCDALWRFITALPSMKKMKSAALKMRTAEIGDMQLGKNGWFSKCCIPTFLKGVASIESAVYYALSADFRCKSPKFCCSGNPCPWTNSQINQGAALNRSFQCERNNAPEWKGHKKTNLIFWLQGLHEDVSTFLNLIDFPAEPWYNISKYGVLSGGEVLCRFRENNAENWKGNLI